MSPSVVRFILPACALFLCFPLMAQQPLVLEPYARMEHKFLDEVSGMAKSPGRENLYWVVNDSGDEARLFAIRSDGSSVIPTYSKFSRWADEPQKGKEPWEGFRVLNATNVDWEDMSADERYLYILDTGNNGNRRQDLAIYVLGEIDPTASTQAAAIRRYPLRYPDQTAFPGDERHFDSESLFVSDDHLYLITKHRGSGLLSRFSFEKGASLYRLDTDYTDEVNVLTKVDANPDILAATSAELSPDGQQLAVLSAGAIWLFDRPASGDNWLSSTHRILVLDEDVRQVETLVWENGQTLLISNEQRDLFRVVLDAQ